MMTSALIVMPSSTGFSTPSARMLGPVKATRPRVHELFKLCTPVEFAGAQRGSRDFADFSFYQAILLERKRVHHQPHSLSLADKGWVIPKLSNADSRGIPMIGGS
jgi:hypothetical protein